MFNPSGLVSISLGSVVLDRPDETGMYIARDMIGGWAYIVGDADGDNLCRGQGVCDGGLDLTLRCAFLSAASHVAEFRQIRILVGTRQAHRIMVQFALKDPHIVAAIAGRPMSVMTRPDARSSFRVRTAAERAASTALRNREQAERHEFVAAALEEAEVAGLGAATEVTATASAEIAKSEPAGGTDWRTHLDDGNLHPPEVTMIMKNRTQKRLATSATPQAGFGWFAGPFMESARNRLAAAGLLAPRRARSSGPVNAWLRELDSHVATVRGDLQDVEA